MAHNHQALDENPTDSRASINENIIEDNQMFVKLKNKRILSLIDSGAKLSCLRTNVANSLKLEYKMDPDTPKFLFGADKSKFSVRGSVLVDVVVQGLRLPVTLHIVDQLCQTLILGIDFLTQSRAVIDPYNRQIAFHGETVISSLHTKKGHIPTPEKYSVRNKTPVLVPPRSEMVILGSIDNRYKASVSLIETDPGTVRKHFRVARALVRSDKGTVPCKLVNPTNEGVFIPRNFRLAIIEPAREIKKSRSQEAVEPHGPQPNNHNPDHQKKTLCSAEELLEDMGIKLDRDKLGQENYDLMLNLLVENLDIFAKTLADIKQTSVISHSIDTGQAKPIFKRAYPHPPEIRDEIARQVAEFVDLGFVRESTSAWNAPVLLVRKAAPSNEKRLVVDFRHLNDVTINCPHSYLATFDEITFAVAEAQPDIFSTLDLRSGYYAIPMREEDKHKTAFSVQGSHYEFNVMGQGICGAPATFCQAMAHVLRGMNFKNCIPYIDDVIVYSHGIHQHVKDLKEIFQRFRENGFSLHPGKCTWAQERVKFLGHIISRTGIECEPSKIEAVKSFPRPHNIKTTRSFVGLANYSRKFISHFGEKCKALNDLLKKDQKFYWGEEQEKAFLTLKEALTSPPVLRHADFSKTFILSTDASDRALSYILQQKDEQGNLHPIHYGSCTISESQRSWPIHEKECHCNFDRYKNIRKLSVWSPLYYSNRQHLIDIY